MIKYEQVTYSYYIKNFQEEKRNDWIVRLVHYKN